MITTTIEIGSHTLYADISETPEERIQLETLKRETEHYATLAKTGLYLVAEYKLGNDIGCVFILNKKIKLTDCEKKELEIAVYFRHRFHRLSKPV